MLLPERSVWVSILTRIPANGAGRCEPGQTLADRGTDAGVGMHHLRTAKFVRQCARLADIAVAADQQFFANTQSGEFPGVVTDTFPTDEAVEQQNARQNPGFAGTSSVHGPAPARLNPGLPEPPRATRSDPRKGAASVLVDSLPSP